MKGTLAEFYSWKIRTWARVMMRWVGLSATIQRLVIHLQASSSSQDDAKTGLNFRKLNRRPPHPAAAGAGGGCRAPLTTMELLVCCEISNVFCCVMGSHSSHRTLCRRRDTVAAAWPAEKAGGSSAVRKKNHTCSNWEKTVEIPSQYGIIELHKIFQPAAVCLVVMYSTDVQTRVEGQGSEQCASQIGISHMEIIFVLLGWVDLLAGCQKPSTTTNVSNACTEER